MTIYMQGQPYPEGLVEVAIVQARGNKPMPDTLSEMEKLAASLGCSSLVNVRLDQGGTLVVNAVCAVEANVPPAPQTAPTR